MTLSDVIRYSLSVRVDIVRCDHVIGDAKKGEESRLDLDCESVERSTLILGNKSYSVDRYPTDEST